MKRTMLMFSSLILILSFLLPGSSVFAQSRTATHSQIAHLPLSSCTSAPSDANCDGQWPDISGCWNGSAYIVHSSGWYANNGDLMQIDLWFSQTCDTAWTDTYDKNATHSVLFRTGITNEHDNATWWSSTLTQNDIWSPMSYFDVEYGHGTAQDGVNHSYHNTPSYLLA